MNSPTNFIEPKPHPKTLIDRFITVARWTSDVVGSVWAFITAILIVLVWLISGPFFHYSDTWQLVINTGTTIVTFLMVFLIQSTQNRDSKALHLKIDELIRAVAGARDSLVDLEELSDEELKGLASEFAELRKHASKAIDKREPASKSAAEISSPAPAPAAATAERPAAE